MPLEHTFIEKMKTVLESEKQRLEEELSRFAKPTEKQGDYETTYEDIGRNREDNALESEVYGEHVALEETLESRLDQVLKALDRIRSGSYGTCISCGNDIEPARLEANPEAEMCIDCANKTPKLEY